jgi:hypothetical protein
LNEQVWGGYLNWELGDRVSTAMDGRIEIRTRETWQRYFDLVAGVGDPAGELRSFGVRFAILFPTRTALIRKLSAAGWASIVRSDQAVVLHRAE